MPGRANRYGGKWPDERARYLAEYPWCTVCLKLGQRVKATDVDHIVPAHPSQKLFWRRSNWRSMCGQHHKHRSGRQAHGLDMRMGCGPDGMPLDPNHAWYKT